MPCIILVVYVLLLQSATDQLKFKVENARKILYLNSKETMFMSKNATP